MEIRPLTPADATAWRAIRLRMLSEHPEAFESDAGEFESVAVAEVEERIRANSGPDQVMYGAFDGADLVGTIGFFQHRGVKRAHLREIWGMYVAPEVRRRGVARALLERAVADVARLEGVRRVNLGVAASNAGARTLYEACGFVAYGTEPDCLRLEDRFEDTVLMSRRL